MPRDRNDEPPRSTRAYGAVNPDAEHYPPTLADVAHGNPPTVGDSTMMPAVSSPAFDALQTRYRLGDVIGRGGMGEVLSARDEQVGRWVAIKRLRVSDPSPEVLARFLREARVQGRLEHPAVVPVHELHHADGSPPYFVMKQLTGVTLADVIPRLAVGDVKAASAFTQQRLLRAFAEVCLAIEFAHTRGVVHRDLKPANIQLGDFGEVYVLDWGIARVASDDPQRGSFADIGTAVVDSPAEPTQTVAGSILGTPGYISPEQIRGDHSLDGRADVYALGCILFEILTHQPLHPRGQGALASALGGVDARASLRAPDFDIPPELDAICVRATIVEAEHRFATARKLGDAVQRYLDGNRDMALRRELARGELDLAHSALTVGASPEARGNAIRAAARALALDPTSREPADIVGRLMLEPPTEAPPEVNIELDRIDVDALAKSARFGLFAALALLVFFPMLYAIGFRNPLVIVSGVAICIFIIGVQLLISPRTPILSSYIAIGGFVVLFGLMSWLLSPVIIGPGPGVIVVMLMASHQKALFRPWKLSLALGVAILGPWLLAASGWMGPTTTVSGNDIIVHTSAMDLHPVITLVALGVYIQATILLAGFLSRLQDDDRRKVRRTMQIQSWQLRQLVPRPQTLPPR
ncbi:MAG: Serine/threonine protein kinase PrkC, regulator of stationary phase [Myxococcales bacterium]|nr:Serine/threonine protein kinase PrkC, regulator of stationary phase [Myxococcales bacterium]